MTLRSKVIALEAKADKKKDDKPKEKPIAVIIKEDPKFLKDPDSKFAARALYKAMRVTLTKKGYAVETDSGEPGSFPNGNAAVWIGHGRGVNRLKFAPYGVKKIEIQGQSPAKDAPEHYWLTKSEVNKIEALPDVK